MFHRKGNSTSGYKKTITEEIEVEKNKFNTHQTTSGAMEKKLDPTVKSDAQLTNEILAALIVSFYITL